MKRTLRFTLFIGFAFLLCSGFSGIQSLAAQEIQFSDSTLDAFSVEELVKIRQLLAKQRRKLLQREEQSREKGLDLSKDFLDKTKAENSNQDKILLRVAEYYIEESKIDLNRRMEAYDKQYEQYEKLMKAYQDGKIKTEPNPPELPRIDYSKPIAIYDLIIKNFPESDLVDDAYYSKAFLYDRMGQKEQARKNFQIIIDRYPESRYAPEAYIKTAESFFYPDSGDTKETTILKLKKAIQLYKNVLQFKDSPRYQEAMYKLGWSYYRLAGENPEYYTDAIINFMGVIEDIEKNKDLDPTGDLVRDDVKPEAIDFIAASFIDSAYSKSGVDNASAFLKKMGLPKFGQDILAHMGDRYAKITLWKDAVKAYHKLLEVYPDYAFAPQIEKKISDAYIAAGELDQAFEERKNLYEKYGPGSDWYASLEKSTSADKIDAVDDAEKISEEAARTNIYYLYKKAEAALKEDSTKAVEYYREFADLAKNYLKKFSTNENAYEINWALAYTLDTKLHDFSKAFQEYIRVSNDYLEDSHRYDAAVNAITVADTLVAMYRASQDTTVLPQNTNLALLPPQGLSEPEKLLAEAYDNFIKLFPNAKETPGVLADAGALYYNHRQFSIAKKYYKTMVAKFPSAQQKSVGLLSIMNSYFFLGQYRDAEIVARKIMNTPGTPPDQLKRAQERLGESIYKNAEKLEQKQEYLAAAKEYTRVFTDAKDYVTFADRALFKSATNYEKAKEWQAAINTYNLLIASYPDSKQILNALGLIAEDYKELGDYANVGKTLERIYTRFPGTKDAETALYNASIFYEKAKNWQDAIRVNNTYIAAYPKNPESKDLLFENANFYLKLGSLSDANRIYRDFAQSYPNDPRTIEAFYERGNYYFDHAKFDSAKIEFNKAIRRSENFARTGRDPNLPFAAEAYYKLGEILYQEYQTIHLSYPARMLRAQLIRKRDKLKEVEKAFKKVIELGSLRSFKAMYQIAQAYEDLADAIANQTLPPNLSRDKLLVEKNRVFKASVPAYERAADEYKNVVVNIPVLAKKLNIDLNDTSATAMVSREPDSTADSSGVLKKVKQDSSRQVARKWYAAARSKISKILFTVAERSEDFITEYLRTPNPFQGIKAFAYQDRVIKQLILPAVQTTLKAHLKNIRVAKELGLNNKYVIESKRKILLANNVIADLYAQMFRDGVKLYQKSVPILADLVERGESATAPNGQNYYDYEDNYVMQLIFYLNAFAKTAVTRYENTLKFAEDNGIKNDALLTTEERLSNFAFDAGELMGRMAKLAHNKSEYFLDKFDSTESPKYQLGSTFFDDQDVEFTKNSRDELDLAFQFSKKHHIQNIWTRLILARLVQLDPATYLANVPKEKVIVTSDTTWFASSDYSPGWNTVDFDASSWKHASEVLLPDSVTFALFDSLGVSPAAIWVKKVSSGFGQMRLKSRSLELEEKEIPETDSALVASADTSGQVADSTAISSMMEPDTVTAYFRDSFSINSKPIDGVIAITGEHTYRFFLNDAYVVGVENGKFGDVQKIPFEAFSSILKNGNNLIAVSVEDTDNVPHLGLRFYMKLELLPSNINELVERIKKVQQEKVDRTKFHNMVILNKNRIVN